MPGKNTNEPLVTIVTPSFNHARFIRATIESVLSQDYPRIEYIVMDGGSSDDTAAVAAEYSSRLTFISEKDRGQTHAINKGFQMARGTIVAWLNSDDTLLPGAVTHAVQALAMHPNAGAVYGDGYQIDVDGNIKSKFPFTEPFNLWKLTYMVDYILQQSVFFRRSALEQIGVLDESLNWGMDWDVLLRLGKKFGLVYTPAMLGCLREHEEAKTSIGGGKRFAELKTILRRHGHLKYPPGYIIYGLDTYEKIWCDRLRRFAPRAISGRLTPLVSKLCRYKIDHTFAHAQGYYKDKWATRKAHFMLPPGRGRIRVRGSLPDVQGRLNGQKLEVIVNGKLACGVRLETGAFDLRAPVPPEAAASYVRIELRASKAFVPSAADPRRLSYQIDSVDWE